MHQTVSKGSERNKKQLRYSNGKWFIKVKYERYIVEQGRYLLLERQKLEKTTKKASNTKSGEENIKTFTKKL